MLRSKIMTILRIHISLISVNKDDFLLNWMNWDYPLIFFYEISVRNFLKSKIKFTHKPYFLTDWGFNNILSSYFSKKAPVLHTPNGILKIIYDHSILKSAMLAKEIRIGGCLFGLTRIVGFFNLVCLFHIRR